MAYKEFLRELRSSCKDDSEYQLRRADRSIAPRRTDYNVLFTAYCSESYGGKNGSEMFDTLEDMINSFLDDNPDALVQMQRYEEKELEKGIKDVTPFILAIVSPLMKRVHTMVIT